MKTLISTKKESSKLVHLRLTIEQKNKLIGLQKYLGKTYAKTVRELLDKHLSTLLGQTSLLEQTQTNDANKQTAKEGKRVERLEIAFKESEKRELSKAANKLNLTVSELVRVLIDKYLKTA